MARLSILRSVRRFCLDCQGGSARAVRACADALCPLRAWRLPPAEEEGTVPDGGRLLPAPAGRMSPRSHAALRAVRRQCLLCAGSPADVRACRARDDCALWSYRFGVRPDTYRSVRRRFFAPKLLTLLPREQPASRTPC